MEMKEGQEMTKLGMKLTALILAVSLLISPFSETRVYAAEAETQDSMDADEQSERESEAETGTEPERETQSDTESGSVVASEAETEPETESMTEVMTNGITEATTDAISEATSEVTTDITTEPETESTSEATTEIATELTTEDELGIGQESETETEPEPQPDFPCPIELEPENVPYDENQEAFTQKLVNTKRTRSTLPATYDARTEGELPAVRNQGSWGACWSFSLIGAMEVSAIRNQYMTQDEIDLSERHLAYFGYNTGYDALDNANEDTMSSPASYYLANGGNDIRGVIRLMNWNGGAVEAKYPYDTSKLPDALERTSAQDARLYLENAYRYDFAGAIMDKSADGTTTTLNPEKKAEAIKVVKKMITDYGAVSWSYYNDSAYLNTATGAYYNNVGGSGTAKTNHAIMAVGWDDTYAKENFKEGRQPENDGAWIIRNSWGEHSGDNGYLYMSYEDVSLGSGNPVYAFTVCDDTKYDNNYFYGNTAYSSATIAVRRAAQVFQIKSEAAVREKLTAVSFLIGTSDVDYEIQIYKNPDRKDGRVVNPTSGTPMLETPQKGKTGYAGLHTITLETPVTFDTDDYAAIVLTFPNTRPSMYFDRSYTSDAGKQKGVHVLAQGRSFYSANLTAWSDNYANNRTFRINALTVNCDDVVKVPLMKSAEVTEAQNFGQLPQVLVRWSKCTGAEGYQIYRAKDNEPFEQIYTVAPSEREFTDTLSERKEGQYFYQVAAVYPDGAERSDSVSVRVKGVIDAPELTLSAYDGYRAVFTWDETGGADGYELWQISDKGSADENAVRIAEFDADAQRTYTIDTDGWALGNYYYKVCAKHGDEQTAWGEAHINRNLTWKQSSYYKAQFDWLPVEGAASYKLFHKVNGKTFSASANKTSVLMSMQSASYRPCDEHQYYIKAYDAAGKELAVGLYGSSTIVFQMTPDALSIDQMAYDYANTVTITYSGGLGAEKIAVYRSETPLDDGELLTELTADATVASQNAAYNDTVHKGKAYWYHLLPIAARTDGSLVEGQTVASDKILTFPEAALLENVQYDEESEGISLAWNAAKGAEGYRIERSTNQKEFTQIAVAEGGDATAYTDQSAEAGNSYQYRVLSYFTKEDGGTETIPAANALDVKICPKPVAFSSVTEIKRDKEDKQKNRTRIALSWNVSQKARSYAVYRSAVSDEAPDNYVCIAENITAGQYTDSTAEPDKAYSYKLVVTMNGLTSELRKTQADTITTKPALTALTLSEQDIELAEDKELPFKIAPNPAHYPYEKELVWTAYDEQETPLEIVQKNDTLVINGVDGKEVLFIANQTIHAVCASETVRLTLVAAIDEIQTQCSIFVYNNDFWVRGVKDLTYTGVALTQDIEVYNGSRLLTEDVDYTVSYKNNVKVSAGGTSEAKKPAVIVKGKGNYEGTKTFFFEILPEPASDVNKISLTKARVKSIGAFVYQGAAIEPKPVVKIGSKTLSEGTDYRLSYKNNDSVGKAAVVISGINDYKGTKEVSFTINYNIKNDEDGLMRVVLDSQDVPYAKGGAKPKPQVYCGSRLLTEGVDYQLSYKNNKALASLTDKKAPAVIVTGKGSYKGKKEAFFNIVQQDIGVLTLTAKDRVYTGKKGKFTTSFVITDKNGKKLSAGRDYDAKSVVYTYAETGMPVGKTDIVPQKTMLRITVNAKEGGAYCGSVSGVYRVAGYDIGKAKVTVEPQTYTESPITPSSDSGVKVTYKGYKGELTEGVDYEITGYADNEKKGTAKLYIRGLGDFCGTKTVRFKIKTKIFQW